MKMKLLKVTESTHKKIVGYCRSKGLTISFFVDKIMDASMDKLIEEENNFKHLDKTK